MATIAATHRELSVGRHLGYGALAGLISGIIFAMLAMVYFAIVGPGLWTPPRLVATILLGADSFSPAFAVGPVVLGMMLHMMLSAVYGAVFGVVLQGVESKGTLVVLGLVFGIAIYLINFQVIAPLLFTAFTTVNQPFQVLAHAMFGIILGGGYVLLARR